MKTVYIVEQLLEDIKTEFSTQEEAKTHLTDLVSKHPTELVTMPLNPTSQYLALYADYDEKEFFFSLEKVAIPDIYDITDEGVGSFITRQPDTVDMETLAPGDKIGRWVDTRIVASIRKPELVHMDNKRLVTEGHEVFEFVLMCYVANIQHHKKFKVYAEWGDRTDIEQTARRGRKVRDEIFAHQLFPMLEDYEFVVN